MSTFNEIEMTTPYGDTDNVLELNIDSSSDAYMLQDVIKLPSTYTFSIWYRTESDSQITFNVLGESETVNSNTTWNKFVKTVTVETLNETSIYIMPSVGVNSYFYEGYLAEGITDTSWLPAPEDIEGEIGSVRSELVQTADSILARVSASDGRISTLETNLEGITGRVEDAEGNISKVSQTVDGVTTEISDAKGSSTTLKARLEGIESTVTDTENNLQSQITQNSEQIALRATKTEVESYINAISIGGRNLIIRHTETEETWINTSGDLETHSNHATSDYISVTPSSDYMFTKKESELYPGNTAYFRYAWYDSEQTYIGRAANSSKEFLWTAPSGAYYVRISYPIDCYPKFEKGNKATDWTPAPEDIDSKINTVESNFTQRADNIEARVETTEGNITSLRTSVDGISGEISDARGSYTSLKANLEGIKTEVLNENSKTNTSLQQLSDKFYLLVNSDISSTSLTLTDLMISALTNQFVIKSSDGSSTVIEGGKILANSITADNLDVGNLSAISANLGTVTAGLIQAETTDGSTMDIDLSAGSIDVQNPNKNQSMTMKDGVINIHKNAIGSNHPMNIELSVQDIYIKDEETGEFAVLEFGDGPSINIFESVSGTSIDVDTYNIYNNIKSWNTYRESFIGTKTYLFSFGNINGGYLRTNEVSIPWSLDEVTISLKSINIPGKGTVATDYKYAGLNSHGGLYVYCNVDGASGATSLKWEVAECSIEIAKR